MCVCVSECVYVCMHAMNKAGKIINISIFLMAEHEFNKTVTNDALLRTECTGIALFSVID